MKPPQMSPPSRTSSTILGRTLGGISGGIIGGIISAIGGLVYASIFTAPVGAIVGGILGAIVGGIFDGGLVKRIVGSIFGGMLGGILGGIVGSIVGWVLFLAIFYNWGWTSWLVSVVGWSLLPIFILPLLAAIIYRYFRTFGGILVAMYSGIRGVPVIISVFIVAIYSGVRGVTVKVWGIVAPILDADYGGIVGRFGGFLRAIVAAILGAIIGRIHHVTVKIWCIVGAIILGTFIGRIHRVTVKVWSIVGAIILGAFIGRIHRVTVKVWGIVGAIILGGIVGVTPAPVIPPFEDMDQPMVDVALVVIGEGMAVSEIQETSTPDMRYQFCYYDATVTVERTLFGPTWNTVTIRQPRNSVSTSGGPGFISTKRRPIEGDRILAFLSRDTSLFDLNEDQFVPRDVFGIEGQDLAKFVGFYEVEYGGECIAGHDPPVYVERVQPLEGVVAWIEEYSQMVLSASNVGVTPSPVYDYESLIDDLRSAGATVEEHSSIPSVKESKRGSPLSRTALEGSGRRVSVNGETIHIYEYPDVLAADTEAGFVSRNGSAIMVPLGGNSFTSRSTHYSGQPYYYKKGQVIVFYVEPWGPDLRSWLEGDVDDPSLVDAPSLVEVLQRALGPQFAGY